MKEWYPERFTIGGRDDAPESPFIVILSNQPVGNKDSFVKLCGKALFLLCADGGANRLKDLALTDEEEKQCALTAICGDLDSIHPETLQHYEKKGVFIFKDEDKYSTDLDKCLSYVTNNWVQLMGTEKILQRFENQNLLSRQVDVVIFGSLGGRADQAFSQIHHLYAMANRDWVSWYGDSYLITPESLVFLLKKGRNRIHAPVGWQKFTETVGIIPLGRPSVVSTRGLEWDVTEWPTEFGTQMSTSNHIKADVVEVESSETVLFTLEFDVRLGS